MIKTRRYINSFIEIKSDDIEQTCYNKTQAEEMKQNLLEAIEDLDSFIKDQPD
tara:strand:- start:842 stop:1000 length:159 start_codon:yes stop_codon:yes gene_type:complete